MTKIALLKNTLPWNQTPVSYGCNEELFLAIYFKLRADGYGECRTSIYEIAEALGYSCSPANICRMKDKLIGYLQNLLLRNTEEFQKVDTATVVELGGNILTATRTTPVTIKLKHNFIHGEEGGFITVEREIFKQICEIGIANHVNTADLFGFYLFMDSKMYTFTLPSNRKIRGCWKYRQSILDGYGFCLTTYMKYRKILHDIGLLFFNQPKSKYKPTLFANEDSDEAWVEIEKMFT